MIISNIDKNITYEEKEIIDENDNNYSACVYQLNILDVDIEVAIGKENISYIDNNIIFFSLYLVFDNRIISKIGLYEVRADKVQSYLDNDGDLNLELLEYPLLFSFVTEEYLLIKTAKKANILTESDIKEKPEKPEIILPPSKIESYDENKSETWIENFLKSNNYSIKDNEGGGDCLFNVIVEGLSDVDSTISVKFLRKTLSDNATELEFQNYKDLYDSYSTSIKKKDTDRLKEIQTENKKLIEDMNVTRDRNYKLELVKRGKELKEGFSQIQKKRL